MVVLGCILCYCDISGNKTECTCLWIVCSNMSHNVRGDVNSDLLYKRMLLS